MSEQQIKFTVFQPNLAPQHLSLPAKTITLGRASDCTIPIKDRFLSRHHAEIQYASGEWIVRDCGSVNGTLLNGVKLTAPMPLKPGDRITLGDSEVVFDTSEALSESRLIPVDSSSHAKNLAIPMRLATDEREHPDRGRERASVLTSLALEFIEDRPMSELFDFILEKVAKLLGPSRTALALLAPDGKTFATMKMRRRDESDDANLIISRTLLGEVIEERNVVSFIDTSQDEKLARAESIIGQHIRSAVCAPLMVGDAVLGVLYLDFLANHGAVTQEDVRLIAQIARFAAVKLETTRLREEAIAKAKIDEELRTAYVIQSRLLPATLPSLDQYVFAGSNRPCKTVSGDYYDVVVRPNGKIYFVIADVSGKGITAALVMSSLATAFNIFTRTDPSPAELVRDLNLTLQPKTAPAKFATLFAAVLDPSTGVIDFTNAGHVPPLLVSNAGVTPLTMTDMVVGLFTAATYRNQRVELAAGDSLVMFTDGVTEAENANEEQIGLTPVVDLLAPLYALDPQSILQRIDQHVNEHIGAAPAGDDVTMLALKRIA
ncbi:MAG TPA: SpoIIE family protein phosphatase [Thermoanaerobaculia bacterium]|nr:SpoIIE family protein phosphatase [Thermoanaerobaculia bacterium]